MAEVEVLRHLTVTGYLIHEGQVLFHWHRLNHMWLPMGGHIEPNEDPVEAVLREVEEESGVVATVMPTVPALPFSNIAQRPPPATIILAPVRACSVARSMGWIGPIEHIDLVYYCRPARDLAGLRNDDPSMRWLDLTAIEANLPVAPDDDTAPAPLAEDVRALALDGLRVAERHGSHA